MVVFCLVGTYQHENIVIVELFFLVSETKECLICLVKAVLVKFDTEYTETMFQGSATRTGSKHDAILIDAHILWIHNLVGLNVLQDTILMDSA